MVSYRLVAIIVASSHKPNQHRNTIWLFYSLMIRHTNNTSPHGTIHDTQSYIYLYATIRSYTVTLRHYHIPIIEARPRPAIAIMNV